jgi:hypothetical protein
LSTIIQMQIRQENLHLREAWDTLVSIIAPAGSHLSAFTQVVDSEGHDSKDSGEIKATGHCTKADGVTHDACPSAWSVISDVVFCGQNEMPMCKRKCNMAWSTNCSNIAKPLPVDSDAVDCQRQVYECGSSSSSAEADDIRPFTGRLNTKEDHANDDMYNVALDINCSDIEEHSNSYLETQKVYVPVLWLLNQAGKMYTRSESHCNVGADIHKYTDLCQLRNYLVHLLENERLVLIFMKFVEKSKEFFSYLIQCFQNFRPCK